MNRSPTSVLLVAFASADEAGDALASVRGLARGAGARVRVAAVVARTSTGQVELHQTAELAAGEGAVAGGAAGLVAGLLLGIPVVGALAGIVGGGGWALRDTGIPDERLRRLGRDLEPGHAVLCVLADEDGLQQLRVALQRYGEVLEAELEPAEP